MCYFGYYFDAVWEYSGFVTLSLFDYLLVIEQIFIFGHCLTSYWGLTKFVTLIIM